VLTEAEKRHMDERLEFWQLLANSVKYGFTTDGVESDVETWFQQAMSGF
jgi:hypothetical protein